ncbi:hypothetical protein JFL47_09385 [Haemophilus haemoglobinophilus]|nr:hypothetical protein [Canicola haemoglobinophilus]
MSDLIIFLILLLVFGAFVWIMFKIVKKIYLKLKGVSSEELKWKKESAKQFVLECLASEVISDEQKEKAEITKNLSWFTRVDFLRKFAKNLISAKEVRISELEKIKDLAECLNISITDAVSEKQMQNLAIKVLESDLRVGKINANLNGFDNDIPLKKDEIAFLVASAVLVATETKSNYVAGSKGVSLKIAKGVYYRVGATKGKRESVKQDVHKSEGKLIITNQRVVFAGELESFEVISNKIINYLFKDAMLIINASNRKEAYRTIIPNELKGCIDAAIKLSIDESNR